MTPDEREEFLLVAKACGLQIGTEVGEYTFSHQYGCLQRRNANGTSTNWNPKTDDGDAFRLAVKLNMLLDFKRLHHRKVSTTRTADIAVLNGTDWLQDARLAIWRAAVAYARSMK